MSAVAEKTESKNGAKDDPAEQLAARIRAIDTEANVSGKDVGAWSEDARKQIAKLIDTPPRLPWEAAEKFPLAAEEYGPRRIERLATLAIAKRLENFEARESAMKEAIRLEVEAYKYMQERKQEASEANKAYSDAKDEWEAAKTHVLSCAKNEKTGQNVLFPEVTKPSTNGKHEGNGKAHAGDRAPKAKTEELVPFGITEAMCEKLVEHKLTTVQKVMDADHKDELLDIPRVGQAFRDKLADALIKWRESNPVG